MKVRARSKSVEAMPRSIEPMLAVLAEMPAKQSGLSFEFKWDGVRAITYYDGGEIKIESRNLLDITMRYPEVQSLKKMLKKRRVVLDGEIVAIDENGRPSFARLQRRMHVSSAATVERLVKSVPIFYVLFDVLYLDGRGLMDEAYEVRRKTLEELNLKNEVLQITPAIMDKGTQMLETAKQNGMEGVVAKTMDGLYEPGRRSPEWKKIKIVGRQEFVIGGWINESTGREDRVGSLLLGYYDENRKFHYAGNVGSGFSDLTHGQLTRELVRNRSKTNPFDEPLPKPSGKFPTRGAGKEIRFVEPRLVAEVEFRRWPEGGVIQQAAFKGLRLDKTAKQVTKEVPR